MRSFLLLFLLLNLLQAAFTGITADEAYYNAWSRVLDWGYFDHPPGTAVVIAFGKMMAGGAALGIRILFVVSQTAALWIVFQKILKAPPSFFLVCLGIPMLHVYGWLATPDALLLLSAALFFWCYQRFLDSDDIGNALLLGLSMSAMLWCKYHGVLVIFFALFSNPRLVKNSRAWIAVVVGVLCFMPHLYWQWTHDFLTFRYHFGERSPEPYVFRHSVEFVVNQLILFHPVLLVMAVGTALHRSKGDLLDRCMKFNLIGFPVFFLATTANNYAEPHWTYVMVIPMLYFLSKKAAEQPFSGAIRTSIWVFAVLLLVARCAVIFPRNDWPLELIKIKAEAKAIKNKAGDLPVVVANSYQITAAVGFYSQKQTYGIGISNGKSRENQYTAIWDDELALQGDTVYVVAPCRFYQAEKLDIPGFPNDELWGKKIAGFQFLKRVKIDLAAGNMPSNSPFTLQITNPYPFNIHIDQKEWSVLAIAFKNGQQQQSVIVPISATISPGETIQITVPTLSFSDEVINDPGIQVIFSLAGREEPFSLN